MNSPDSMFSALLVENSPDALIALSPEATILYWNRGAELVFGYPREEATGKNILDLVFSEEVRTLAEEEIRKTLEKGLTVYETFCRRKDGMLIRADISQKVIKSGGGPSRYLAAAIRDITQVQALRDASVFAARFAGLLESMPDAIVMVNNTGRIVVVNEQATRMFGYNRQDLLGKPIEVLLPARFKARHIGHRGNYFALPRTRPMG